MSPKNYPPFLTELIFAPGQHPHSIGLVVVPTLDDMQKAIADVPGVHIDVPEAGGGLPRALCYFDHDADTQMGFVIFAEETLTPAIIVHELTHAGMFFVIHKVMPSKNVQAKSEEEQSCYYDEACAHIIENLFDQAFSHLYTVTRKTTP